jgi:RNA polymerase subunit RPABC4/transcription elongation factor Spt4
MAINPCKECGGPVSDKAESCPLCGAKQKKKTSIWAWLGLVLIVLAGIGMCSEKSINGKAKNSTQEVVESETDKPLDEVKTNWVYKKNKDEMRGIESRFATNVSTNQVEFDFPYNGGSNLTLTVRETGNEKDILIGISKGQFICGINDCEFAFKFDDGAVESITMTRPENYASDIMFVSYDKTEDKIIEKLKTSKKLIIEAPFYQEGRKQFTFNVSGFEWK